MQPHQLLEWLFALLMLILAFMEWMDQQKGAPRSKGKRLWDSLREGFSVRIGPFRVTFEGGSAA